MIGMNDLEILPEAVEPSADNAALADRQELACIAAAIGEEHDIEQVSVSIACPNTQRRLGPARLVTHNIDSECDDLSFQSAVDGIDPQALDLARRQMKQEIDDARYLQPLELTLKRWTNAFQRRDFREQGVEDIGPHGISLRELTNPMQREAQMRFPLIGYWRKRR
ncbi:hypothetical protein SmB9_32120 [Sphingosinicella microcystinivorans]|uniref:Uncharacterized protein n=1 Tax=Sphingosinicella microcystinivorans TaxID=335406 RepID=A0AAD1D8I8_SPHMI|nr:hypothetical protein SmB9_32120 [Sphingosinicella microcystinivorans]